MDWKPARTLKQDVKLNTYLLKYFSCFKIKCSNFHSINQPTTQYCFIIRNDNSPLCYFNSNVDIGPLFCFKLICLSRSVWNHYRGEYTSTLMLKQLIPTVRAANCPTMHRRGYFTLSKQKSLILTIPTTACPIFKFHELFHQYRNVCICVCVRSYACICSAFLLNFVRDEDWCRIHTSYFYRLKIPLENRKTETVTLNIQRMDG